MNQPSNDALRDQAVNYVINRLIRQNADLTTVSQETAFQILDDLYNADIQRGAFHPVSDWYRDSDRREELLFLGELRRRLPVAQALKEIFRTYEEVA